MFNRITSGWGALTFVGGLILLYLVLDKANNASTLASKFFTGGNTIIRTLQGR